MLGATREGWRRRLGAGPCGRGERGGWGLGGARLAERGARMRAGPPGGRAAGRAQAIWSRCARRWRIGGGGWEQGRVGGESPAGGGWAARASPSAAPGCGLALRGDAPRNGRKRFGRDARDAGGLEEAVGSGAVWEGRARRVGAGRRAPRRARHLDAGWPSGGTRRGTGASDLVAVRATLEDWRRRLGAGAVWEGRARRVGAGRRAPRRARRPDAGWPSGGTRRGTGASEVVAMRATREGWRRRLGAGPCGRGERGGWGLGGARLAERGARMRAGPPGGRAAGRAQAIWSRCARRWRVGEAVGSGAVWEGRARRVGAGRCAPRRARRPDAGWPSGGMRRGTGASEVVAGDRAAVARSPHRPYHPPS